MKNEPLERPVGNMGNEAVDTSIVLAYEEQLMAAYRNAGIETIAGLYHDDLIFNSPDGKVLSKTDDLEALGSGMLKIQEYNPSNCIIRVIDDTAAVSVSIHIKARIAENGFEGDFKFLRIWKRKGTAWKVIAISGQRAG
jgi:ketosteroid isomerase-like protein